MEATTTKTMKEKFGSSLNLAKIYYIVAIVKFPLVISKNGILNGALSIFLIGGICSTISNLLLAKVTRQHNEKTYLGVSKTFMGRFHALVKLVTFIFRCIVAFYMLDLSHKLFRSLGIELLISPESVVFALAFILTIDTFLLPDPNVLISGASRNTVTIVILGITTSILALLKYESNIEKIQIFNSSDKFFDSFPLTFICFAQQIGTTSILKSDNGLYTPQILLGGALSALGYILVGITGYLSYPNPELNWCFNIEDTNLRAFNSLILLSMNILQYPVIFNPIRDDVQHFMNLDRSPTAKSICNMTITFFLTFYSLKAVATKVLPLACLIFSAIIMIIFPSLFFLRSKDKSRFSNSLAYLNLTIGGCFIVKACMDGIGLIRS